MALGSRAAGATCGFRTRDECVVVCRRSLLRSQGLHLPTTEQWEYALADQGRNQKRISQRSLDWFAAPNPEHLRAVGRGEPNGFGIYDLVGLVWEWTLDNNSFMTGTEQRNTSSKDDAAFCGSGSVGRPRSRTITPLSCATRCAPA